MMNGEVIGKRISAVFNSLQNNVRRETGYQIIKWALLIDLSPVNPGGLVGGNVYYF